MVVFIKKSSDLSTAWYGEAASWSDVPLESIGNESGQIVIPDDGNDYSGDFLVLIGGKTFYIDKTSPNNGTRTLTVVAPYNYFKRDLIWPEGGVQENETYGHFISREITRNYRQCSDLNFRISFIRVSSGRSDIIMPPGDPEPPGIYNLLDIFEEAVSSGVLLNYEVKMAGDDVWVFTCTTKSNDPIAHNIFFNDGHSLIISETYSKDLVAKLTIFHPNTIEVPDPEDPSKTINETEYDTSEWYLDNEGNISSTVPEQLAEGTWRIIEIQEDEIPEEMASKTFAENINSHKVEFYSDYDMSVWDPVFLRINGKVFTSYITSKHISSNQEWFIYTCGELPTTLTDRVNKLENEE